MNKPYVYIIQNKEQTYWYVGMRSANECPANEDTGYWGSSSYLDELIVQTGKENWTKTVIKEFDDAAIAHEFEQMLIESMWHSPGRVNKGRGGFVDHGDPEVKGKHKAGCQERSENSEWRANQKAGVQKALAKPFIATSIATGEEFYCESSICAQSKALELAPSAVSRCLNGKHKQHKGFAFKYA